MKKIFTMSMVAMLVVAMAITSFAAGVFVASPSGINAPKLVSATNKNIDCIAELVIESYKDCKDDAKMSAAYKSIKGTDDISTLNKELANIAKNHDVDASKLAVSDLFNITHVGCNDHSNCGEFTITIRPNTTENFIALMHFNGTDWEIIETTVEDGCITFTVSEFSPFAIVAHDGTGKAPISAGAVAGIGVGIAIIVAAIVVFVVLKKKKRHN